MSVFVTVLVEAGAVEVFSTEQPVSNSGARMPQSPRRLTHQLPPRLNIHPASASELGPPAQVWRTLWKEKRDFYNMTFMKFIYLTFVILI